MGLESHTDSYDQVPYPTYPLPQTHPRRMETVAHLLGLSPPSTENCRVLELGCGDGGNLIPMAVASPDCEYVGIDASAVQIEMGVRRIAALNLTNVQLHHLRIDQIEHATESFDYIICHGVFSWVSMRVQKAILRVIQEFLTPNGIAYVSYNTQPGWHARGAIRNMMNFHVGHFEDQPPAERIAQARRLLAFLTNATASHQSGYALTLRENLDLLNQLPDAYLFHEHLEEHNQPVWFLDFCDGLAKFDLRYLGEADFSSMFPGPSFSEDTRRELEALAPGLLQREQYMDFLRNRSFRQTLICRNDCHPNYSVRASRLDDMFIGTSAAPENMNALDLAPGVSQRFVTSHETALTAQLPIFKAALVVGQRAWPQSIAMEDLYHEAMQLLDQHGLQGPELGDKSDLAKALLTTYSSTSMPLVELARCKPMFAIQISASPVASPLVRLQARDGNIVSNLRHESVKLSELDRALISMLDGTHIREALLDRLNEYLDNQDPDNAVPIDSDHLMRLLNRFARTALLQA